MTWLAALLPPREDRFAAWVARALEAKGAGPFEHDPVARTLRAETGQVVHLENLFAEFVHAPFWKRPSWLRAIADAFPAPGGAEPSFEEALPHLVPRVRDRIYAELLPYWAEGLEVPWEVFGESFALSLALDSDAAVRDVTQRDLDRWGKSFDELLPVAKHRLAAASEPLRFDEVRPGLHRSAWNDVYDASRVALPGILRTLRVKGAHVAALPNRNTLLVAGSDDPDALLALLALASEILETEPRPQSGRLLVLEGTTWVPFEPADPRVRAALARRSAIDRARDYADQKSALDGHFEKNGRDCFVATCSLVEHPDGSIASYAVWADGVTDALLPEVDELVFAYGPDDATQIVRVSFSPARALLSHRMSAQGMTPERWHTTTFPSDEELEQLRAIALPDGAAA